MNWNNIESNWSNFKHTLQDKWANLTDDDLSKIDGNRDQLIGIIQDRYAMNEVDAGKAVNDWQNSQTQVDAKLAASTGLDSSPDFEADDDLKSEAYLEPSNLESATGLGSSARLNSGNFATSGSLSSSNDLNSSSGISSSSGFSKNLDATADPAAEAKYNPDYTGADSKEMIDDEGQPIDEGYGRSENADLDKRSKWDKKPGAFNNPSPQQHQEKSVDQT